MSHSPGKVRALAAASGCALPLPRLARGENGIGRGSPPPGVAGRPTTRSPPWPPAARPGGPRCEPGGDPSKLSCIELVARLLTDELRMPLNAITGFAELLLAGDGGPLSAELRSAVAEIARAARDLEAAMAAAGVLIELGLLPPCAAAGPLPLAPLLRDAGFEQVAGEPLVVVGTADRWAGILSAVRGFLVRRADRRCDCLALPVRGSVAVGVRLWRSPARRGSATSARSSSASRPALPPSRVPGSRSAPTARFASLGRSGARPKCRRVTRLWLHRPSRTLSSRERPSRAPPGAVQLSRRAQLFRLIFQRPAVLLCRQ